MYSKLKKMIRVQLKKLKVDKLFLFFLYGKKVFPMDTYYIFQGMYIRFHEQRFFFKDKFFRKPYKVVDYKGEFGPELKFSVPFAYWHYLNGTLKETISYKGTKEFYFFSPKHVEVERNREYLINPLLPNSEDHNLTYSLKKWHQVDFSQRYKKDFQHNFSKPILIVSNKYNVEWDSEPVNYISIHGLETIINKLQGSFEIIYNRPKSDYIVNDGSAILEYEDKKMIREKFPDVHFAEELYAREKHLFSSFNHFQLALYANAENFVSVQGGNSVLCSYFGGTNVVLVLKGYEIQFKEYENFYSKLSGANVIPCYSTEQFHKAVEYEYLSKRNGT